jgi:mannan endo-1,4-beta-mannosidase
LLNLRRADLLVVPILLLALACAPSAVAASKKVGVSSARVAGPSKEGLSATTQSPSDGETVSGPITWSVSVIGTASRVDFVIDGTTRWSQASSPYLYGGSSAGLDTATLANGAHTLTAVANGARGVKATTSVVVTVENAAPDPAPAPAPEPTPTQGPSGGALYWGATIGSHLTGTQAPWDTSAISKFEENAHKRLSLVQFFQPFANCGTSPCSFYSFPTTPLENIRLHGAIPVLSWSSQSIPSSLNEPNFQLSDVIEGRHDSYIRSFATAAKAWGHPFFIRFNWEMNGTWFPWSEGVNGNRAGEFVAAWRRVHDLFAEVGATNVTWVWCPNVDYNNNLQAVTSNYPGEAYVDWTGLDGYNWGTNPTKPGGWKTFGQVYRSTYLHIVEKVAPSKPLMIGEVASTEYGGSKASWTKDMLARLPSEYRQIRALIWFDKFDSGMDWPIETSSGATTGFAEGIKSPAYLENAFVDLGAGTILPG